MDKPELLNGDDGGDSKLPPGVMVNAEGQFVIAEPDKASWEKFQAKTKSSAAAAQAAEMGDKELQDRGLECTLDKRIFIDPMKTPCCEKTYCNDCITNALIESDFTCPGCQTEGVLIDDLKPDDETSAKITAYLEEKNAALRKEKERSRTPPVVVKAESPPTSTTVVKVEKAKSASPAPKSPPQTKDSIKTSSIKSSSKSPPNTSSTPALQTPTIQEETKPTQSKKRPAEELLENPKIPKGPKAMQQQEAQKKALFQQQQQQAMMNNMSGFPNPFNMPGMNMMNGMPNFNPGMMNGMPNMMNGFNPMMGMQGMNPMMGMMGMNGMNGGFPSMYGNNAGYGGMGGMGMMNGGMNGGQNGNGNGANGGMPQFANQQKTTFSEPLLNEEDNAYFRQPVNPHRHQGRQRRARPSDYREL